MTLNHCFSAVCYHFTAFDLPEDGVIRKSPERGSALPEMIPVTWCFSSVLYVWTWQAGEKLTCRLTWNNGKVKYSRKKKPSKIYLELIRWFSPCLPQCLFFLFLQPKVWNTHLCNTVSSFPTAGSVHSVHQDPVQHFPRRSGGGVPVPGRGPRDQPPPADGGGGAEAAGAKQPARVPQACRCLHCGTGRGVSVQWNVYQPRKLQHLQLQQQSGQRLRAVRNGVVLFVRASLGFASQRAGHSHLLWKARWFSDQTGTS